MSQPSAEAQIAFLQQVQRLFAEGEFSATYKFALLLALAELAVECGDDSGNAMDLPMLRVGEKFAELYWRQLAEYGSGLPHTTTAVLHQNHGTQAVVIQHLQALYQQSGGKLSVAQRLPEWPATILAVAGTVRTMPLRHLQVLGGTHEPFLYDYPCPRGVVRLKPGVAFNLRRYQGLIQQLGRAGWVEHIRSNKLNTPMLGQIDDLETFMFGAARSALADVAKVLAPLQDHRCFYCKEKIDQRAEVDHFIPWARYPRDTAHNFVLAHQGCNNGKRDMLAGEHHLETWLHRLQRQGAEMSGLLDGLGFVTDNTCSIRIARWAYQQGVATRSLGWVARNRVEPLTAQCLSLFVV
ncbi:HNH endonuclease [Vogesella facilis]|uniref:HNH endonuclease n=1 Tax=Vogesella facilis TaxID=1655232 RepID=A0ABV7R965_9NEIS